MTETRKFTNQDFEAITPLLDASLTASTISQALDNYDLDDDDIESMRDRLDDASFERLQHVHAVLEEMRGMTFDVPAPPAAEVEDDYDDGLYGEEIDEDDEVLAPDGPNVEYASEEDEE